MTHKQKLLYAYILAFAVLLGSFAVWTTVVSATLAGNIWASLVENEFVYIADRTAVVEEQDHRAAPEPNAPDKSTHESAPDQAPVSPVVQELEQWEVDRWLALSIPSINVRTPIFLPSRRYWDAKEWNLLEEQMQVGLLRGAVAYPHSVSPGHPGSLIIAGHSSPPDERSGKSSNGRLFERLPELKKGDTISVLDDAMPVTYKVTDSKIVPPTATELLAQNTDESVIKLITCYPVGTTKNRLIVTAKKI